MIEKTRDVSTPRYSHEGDAGLDLCSAEDVVLEPMQRRVISTGIKVALPKGYVGLIWDRSGLASRSSLHCLAGVVDSSYRGEVGVVMINLGKQPFKIEKNMRIAQFLVQPVIRAEISPVDRLPDTERNAKGFGSTGL